MGIQNFSSGPIPAQIVVHHSENEGRDHTIANGAGYSITVALSQLYGGDVSPNAGGIISCAGVLDED